MIPFKFELIEKGYAINLYNIHRNNYQVDPNRW
jgi:hypothetical protein